MPLSGGYLSVFHLTLRVQFFSCVTYLFPEREVGENSLGIGGFIPKPLSLQEDILETTFCPSCAHQINVWGFLETRNLFVGMICYKLFEIYLMKPIIIQMRPKTKTRHTCSSFVSTVSIAPIPTFARSILGSPAKLTYDLMKHLMYIHFVLQNNPIKKTHFSFSNAVQPFLDTNHFLTSLLTPLKWMNTL